MLCERKCGINRCDGHLGFCNSSATPKIVRAAPHMWEEPIISGKSGSGAIFFSGCSLKCIYCQNHEISRGNVGREVSHEELSQIMLSLALSGVHNINFVTPTHYIPSLIAATGMAKEGGLNIPIVYNTGSYETEEALRHLDGTVDIYLPDLKYYRASLAKKYSMAENLPHIARRNIDIMVEQRGEPVFSQDGMLKSGVVVRLLLLPGALADTKLNLKYLYNRYRNKIYISLMSQYTPPKGLKLPTPIDRRVTLAEYRELVKYAESLGVMCAFTQDRSSATEIYVPPFDGDGVK